jgi:hypothetical protein
MAENFPNQYKAWLSDYSISRVNSFGQEEVSPRIRIMVK